MLVLSRNQDESIVIGDGDKRIEIMVVKSGGRVKLGITAPSDQPIRRKEIVERIAERAAEDAQHESK